MNYSALHQFRHDTTMNQNDEESLDDRSRKLVRHGTNNCGGSLDEQIDRLVSGTLTSQAYTQKLEDISQRCESFDERLTNLIRLVKLSQGIQEEKDTELRRECDELRARLKREEQHSANLQRELDALKENIPLIVKEEIRSQLPPRVDYSQFCTVTQFNEAIQAQTTQQTQQKKELRHSIEQLSQRLAATDEALSKVHEGPDVREEYLGELSAAHQWTRKNMLRLKQHIKLVSETVDTLHDQHRELETAVGVVDKKTEGLSKNLRRMLQQKSTEADALNSLLEKELNHVRMVAQQHEVLRDAHVAVPAGETIDHHRGNKGSRSGVDLNQLKF